jgi:hypothetical protein
MDDRERLYALCKEHEIDIHHKSGVAKLQQALLDAGIEFELADTPSDRGPDPDLEIPHPGAPKADDGPVEVVPADDVYVLDASSEEHIEPPMRGSDMVEVLVMVKNVHVQAVDLGRPPSATSTKLFFKERHKLARPIAERLAGRGQVEIL